VYRQRELKEDLLMIGGIGFGGMFRMPMMGPIGGGSAGGISPGSVPGAQGSSDPQSPNYTFLDFCQYDPEMHKGRGLQVITKKTDFYESGGYN
jgi:hypothetical protein